MGCLVGEVTQVGEGLRIGVERIGENIQLSANRASEGLRIEVDRIGENIQLYARRVSEGLQMSVGLVCTTSDVFYIKVTPQVIWLTEANNFMGRIEVDSNTNWRIEIKE